MKAHGEVAKAIREGRLTRATVCEVCASDAHVVAHHDDYAKPLDVRWLCRKCHVRWHRMNVPLNRPADRAAFVTLPVDLHAALKERASEERRSMNAQAIIAIEEHLRKEVAA